MAELSLNLPVVGEKDTTAEPKVTTALSEIQTQVNGKITTVNLENEGVTGKKLGTETLRMLGATVYGAETARVVGTEYEPSATRAVFVVLRVGGKSAETCTYNVLVGGVQITQGLMGAIAATAQEATFSFICPATLKWKVTGSNILELSSSYLTL